MKTLEGAIAALVALDVGTGCTTTTTAHRPLSDAALAEVNRSIDGRATRVVLAEEPEQNAELRRARRSVVREAPLESREVEAELVEVERDTTKWLEPRPGAEGEWRPSGAPTASLKSISFRQRGRGALEGLGIFFLLGAIPGAVAGAAAQYCSFGSCSSAGALGAGIGALVIGIPAGILLGLPIGAAIGHRTTIQFDDTAAARALSK
jgi:hypothetical protein